MKSKVIAWLMLLLTGFSAQAQTISGKLVDEENRPLAYANVVLLSLPDSTFVSGATSDEMGDFRISIFHHLPHHRKVMSCLIRREISNIKTLHHLLFPTLRLLRKIITDYQ